MSKEMQTLIQNVKFAREAGAVKRLHTERVIQHYDVAQHTFNALCLLRLLYPTCSPALIWALLSHDLPERITGDIPSPSKRMGKWFDKEAFEKIENTILYAVDFDNHSLSKQEQVWVRAIDMLEFWLFCLDEEMMGNRTLLNPKQRVEKYIEAELHEWPDKAKEFYETLKGGLWSNIWKMSEISA